MSVQLTFEESHGLQESRFGILVEGPTDRAGLRAEILAELPATISDGTGVFVLKSFDGVQLIPGHDDLWQGSVTYGAMAGKEELKTGESEFRFSSAKEQIRQTFSPSSRAYGSAGSISPADLHLIGYKPGENRSEGVTVTEYYNAFSWRVAVPFSVATESWRRAAGALRGTVCLGSFFGYSAETCLMDDITGSVTGAEIYTFDLNFLQKDHPGTISVAGISVPNVKAWETIDTVSTEKIDTTDKKRLSGAVDYVKVHYLPRVTSWSLLSDLLGV